MFHQSDHNQNALPFFLFGAAVGAVTALLMAPRSGEEMRRTLSDAGGRVGEKVRQAADKAKDKAKDIADSLRHSAEETAEKIKGTAQEVATSASSTYGSSSYGTGRSKM